jgi:hypothetical protein
MAQDECIVDEIKYTCGEPSPRVSEISYDNSELPEWSELSGDARCDNTDAAVRELYAQLSTIRQKTDLTVALHICTGIDMKGMTLGNTVKMMADRLCALTGRYNALLATFNHLPACQCGEDGCL